MLRIPCPCASLEFCRDTKRGNPIVYLGEETEGMKVCNDLLPMWPGSKKEKNAWKTEVSSPVMFCGSLTQPSLLPALYKALGFSEHTPPAN